MKNFISGSIIEAKIYLVVLRERGSSFRIRVHTISNETKYYDLKLF